MFARNAIFFVVATASDISDMYNQPPTTLYGCECVSSCGTNSWMECDDLPYCRVKSNTCTKGKVLFGYDYCVWDSYPTYEKLSAAQKQQIVLSHITADTSSDTYPSTVGLTGLFTESVVVSFNVSADVFPMTRKKYIHTVGVAGGMRFDSTGGHPYTGLFQGAEYGIIRLSSAFSPSSSAGVAPGMGMKFFRDGRPSANFVAMYRLSGQPCSDTDFFAHDWHNHVPKPTSNFALEMVAKKFWQASSCPLQVGLSDLASSESGSGTFPYMLTFHPAASVDCPCTDYSKCLANLQNLKSGTKLFDVLATASPGAEAQTIGSISLTTDLTTSKFGDEQLLFSHQQMEEDFRLQPGWLASIDKVKDCAMGSVSTTAPTVSQGCTSPFNDNFGDMFENDVDIVV